MQTRALAILLALALAGCATSPPPPAADQTALAPAPEPRATAAGWAVSIVGTPFAVGLKGAVCVASLAIAAPIAGLLALNPDPYPEGLDTLGDGIANNCGPPWVVSPYAAS